MTVGAGNGLEAVASKLRSSEWAVRVAAVRALERINDPHAIELLERALYDPDNAAVTQAAAQVLARRGGDDAARALLLALDSEDGDVGDEVQSVLYGESTGWLVDAAMRLASRDPAATVRRAAALALGTPLYAGEARELLERLAGEDPDESVREHAKGALLYLETVEGQD